MYLNKVYLIGNLTRDPEVKALPSGTKLCQFGMATNKIYKDKEGVKKEATEYHNIVAFNKLGELSGQYLKKGQQALVEGRLQTRSW
ncbi:MAG: single-stranded DNA-binding protein, partial [Patescibacteria group bacterium]